MMLLIEKRILALSYVAPLLVLWATPRNTFFAKPDLLTILPALITTPKPNCSYIGSALYRPRSAKKSWNTFNSN